MDVREKLVRLLFLCSPQNTKAELCGEKITVTISQRNIADYLVSHGVTVQEWIPVSEKLPKNKGNYLGFTGSTSMVAYYKGNGIWWSWLNDVEGENLFTHWLPLPQPPKGE